MRSECRGGAWSALLGVVSPEEARISILLNQRDEFLNRRYLRGGLVTVPLKVLTQPEDSPAVPCTHVRGLRKWVLAFLASGPAPDRPHLE